ncbi:hypothetical protein D3C71_1768160 [compost metagenome]
MVQIVAPRQGVHLGHQHSQIEGLLDKVVGPHVHGHNHVHILVAGGEEQNRHLGGGSDLLAPMVAVQHRQVNVQQHQLRAQPVELRQHLVIGRYLMHLELPLAQCIGNNGADFIVILHQHNGKHRDSPVEKSAIISSSILAGPRKHQACIWGGRMDIFAATRG